MLKVLARYGAGLIAVYLFVNYASGSGALINNTTGGAVNVVKAFQGR